MIKVRLGFLFKPNNEYKCVKIRYYKNVQSVEWSLHVSIAYRIVIVNATFQNVYLTIGQHLCIKKSISGKKLYILPYNWSSKTNILIRTNNIQMRLYVHGVFASNLVINNQYKHKAIHLNTNP